MIIIKLGFLLCRESGIFDRAVSDADFDHGDITISLQDEESKKCLRAQVLKLNGVEIIDRGQTFKWSLDAIKSLFEDKLGECSRRITDIDLQNLECSSIALKELLCLSVERIN